MRARARLLSWFSLSIEPLDYATKLTFVRCFWPVSLTEVWLENQDSSSPVTFTRSPSAPFKGATSSFLPNASTSSSLEPSNMHARSTTSTSAVARS